MNLKPKNGNYENEVTFEQIVESYLFNANFRQIIFPETEKVEINVREDIEGLVRNVKAQNVPLFRDIFTSSYQCGDECYEEKEVLIQDPDGYLLRFSETQKVKYGE